MVVGGILVVLGLIPPVHAFVEFARAGGTPMPVAPTERLVVTGFNRFVRPTGHSTRRIARTFARGFPG
ncbi:hypothetical protein AU197_08245 [Mycobacterium sp. IS-1590]|nr:hypothetical protein AU197_08245 [Mycobacterium sp. IS-1590]